MNRLTADLVAHARREAGREKPEKSITKVAAEAGVLGNTLGRAVRGETWTWMTDPPPVRRSERAGLTRSRVVQARREVRARTTTAKALAARWNLSETTISYALTGRTWSHVTDPPPLPATKRERLSADLVSATRRAAARETPETVITRMAAEAGVKRTTLARAVRGERWTKMQDPPPVPATRRTGLTAAQVGQARRQAAAAGPAVLAVLAARWGFHERTLRSAVRGATWTQMQVPPPVPATQHHPKVLTGQRVSEARRTVKAQGPKAIPVLAARWGMSVGALRKAVYGHSWKHVPEPPPQPSRSRAVGGVIALDTELVA